MTPVLSSTDARAQTALFLAWGTALGATLGALFVGEVLGQAPCVLCWYQRIAMFPLALILGIALYRNEISIWRYALPLSISGGAVAFYHSGLYIGLIPEPIVPCTRTGPSCTDANMSIWGGVPLPVLSLLSFALITACLMIAARIHRLEISQ